MVKVKITNGYVGPTSLLPYHWHYTPYQRREYNDGLVILLEESYSTIGQGPKVIGTVWIAADGLRGGWHRRVINSPADIGALYTGFRRGLIQLGLYDTELVNGVWHSDGRRRFRDNRQYNYSELTTDQSKQRGKNYE